MPHVRRLLSAAIAVMMIAAAAPTLRAADVAGAETAPITTPAVKARMAAIPALEAAEARQLRVIWTTDPATSATIAWSSATLPTNPRVLYDTEPRRGDVNAYARRIAPQISGPYTGSSRSALYHHARLTGLEPSTTYYFVIISDGHVSREFHFTTAPAPGDDRPVALLVGGDSRSDEVERSRINLRIAQLAERDPTVLAIVHGGDYVFHGSSWKQWNGWLDHQTLTITDSGRVLPIIPVRGNHDGGELFDEVFDTPGGDGNYYATQLGSAALVTLNTEISAAGDQKQWLAKQLKQLRPAHRWMLASYHKPAWPAVKGSPGSSRSWVSLFEKHDVDLALEADGHCIKRTVPIRNNHFDPTGVVYVGEGGMGVPQRTPNDRWYLQSPGMAGKGHHVMRLDFTPTAMRVRTILVDGEVMDDYARLPREAYLAAGPEHEAAPTQ